VDSTGVSVPDLRPPAPPPPPICPPPPPPPATTKYSTTKVVSEINVTPDPKTTPDSKVIGMTVFILIIAYVSFAYAVYVPVEVKV
jgi:hypothetical protein